MIKIEAIIASWFARWQHEMSTTHGGTYVADCLFKAACNVHRPACDQEATITS